MPWYYYLNTMVLVIGLFVGVILLQDWAQRKRNKK